MFLETFAMQELTVEPAIELKVEVLDISTDEAGGTFVQNIVRVHGDARLFCTCRRRNAEN